MNVKSLSNSYLESLFNNTLQSTATSSTASATTSSPTSSSVSEASQPSDSSQLSPFAQILNTLQQLQQSNPTEYQQVTKQISTNLQSAAQSAQADGNTSAANQLNQLASDFTTASTSGQLPNIQDLAQALGGGHHHHQGHGGGADLDQSTSIVLNALSSVGLNAASNI
jgi:aromatic ring hydroxylase